MVEVLAIFIKADRRIKGVQIGDHETKQQILLITPPIFLKDIICLIRMQVILKLYEASRSKINFSKSQTLHAGSYKKELIKQDKWYGHNFPLKYLDYILVVLSLVTSTGAK